MKVAEIIERLNRNYTPDTELYVQWWDRDIAERFYEGAVSDEEWVEVVEKMEDGERIDQSMVADAMIQATYEVLSSNETEEK